MRMGVFGHPPFSIRIHRVNVLDLLKTKRNSFMKFYGIADAHGLESFNPVTYEGEIEGFQIPPTELSMLGHRANANRHRHAVVYSVDVSVETAKKVLDLMKKAEYAKALETVKEENLQVSLMRLPGSEKSWKMIPNPDLDPFSS